MSPPPPQIKVYHITHVDNLATILRDQALYSANEGRRRGILWTSIAHAHIRSRRDARIVLLPPHGVLNHYVPWYFGPRPPMLLPVNDGLVQGYSGGQEPVIHLVTSPQRVTEAGRPWLFTNVHPVLAYADFYNDLRDLDKLDWPLMTARIWRKTDDDPERPSRRQAEFLVWEHLPWTAIESIGVLNEAMASRVRAALAIAEHKPQVEVRPGWYY